MSRSSSPNCTRENPRNPCTRFVCKACKERFNSFLKRCRRADDKHHASDDALRKTPHHHLDSPTLLKKRLGIATEDMRLLRAKMAKLERQIQGGGGKRKDNEPVSESNLPKSRRQMEDVDDVPEVEDADTLLKRLGYEL